MIQICISSTILKQGSFAKKGGGGGKNFNIFEKERHKLTPRINHKEIFFSLVIRRFYSNIRKDDPTSLYTFKEYTEKKFRKCRGQTPMVLNNGANGIRLALPHIVIG